MNQLFYDLTSQLQQYSQYGTPIFITTAQNQGVPFPYPIYARVYHSGVVYENQVASNIVTPGVDDSWLVISGDATGVLTGTILDYAGSVAPSGYLACDGSAVLRASYGPLLGVISQTQTGTTTVSLNTVTGLTSTAQMYVGMSLECANFAPGTTVASIVTSTSITASNTASASGAISILFFNWGNGNGSTTFNVPDLRRYTTIGQGGVGTSEIGNVVGQTGGEEAHLMDITELVGHTHAINIKNNSGSPYDSAQPASTANPSLGSISTASTGGGVAFNIIQPSAVMLKIIKT
jgi:microcystin-dependent protein